LKHFIAAVRGEVEPDCSAEDGLKVVLVIEAIFKSLASGMPVVVEQL
jgi:predicted dehydrogenase